MPRGCSLVIIFPLAVGVFFCPSRGTSQTTRKTPAELVRSLSRDPRSPGDGFFSCGIREEQRLERSIALELVAQDQAAVPELERALRSIERERDRSRFSANGGLLALAYAQIQEPAALPLLRRMLANPKGIGVSWLLLDDAVAVSLGITSYVSGSPIPRGPLPRGG